MAKTSHERYVELEFRFERVLMATRILDGICGSPDMTPEWAHAVIEEERKAEYERKRKSAQRRGLNFW